MFYWWLTSLYYKCQDLTPSIKDALLQMCCKDVVTLGKPQHIGSVLNVISKHIEKKGCDSIGLDILDFFIWFQKKSCIYFVVHQY